MGEGVKLKTYEGIDGEEFLMKYDEFMVVSEDEVVHCFELRPYWWHITFRVIVPILIYHGGLRAREYE